MGAHAGRCDSLAALEAALYDGRQQVRDLPPTRWKARCEQAPRGAYIEDFEFDFLRFGVPPQSDGAPIPQQLLVLTVADEAIRDAQLAEGAHVAVVVAMQPEPELHRYATRLDFAWQVQAALMASGIRLSDAERDRLLDLVRSSLLPATSVNQYVSFIGNIMASRIAAQWDFSGPAFTVSAGDNSALQALDVARHLLVDASISAVVVAGVDLPGSQEGVLFRRDSVPGAGPTMSHDASARGWLVGEGAGAIVVRRVLDSAGQRVYATVDGLALARGAPAAALGSASRRALLEAGVAAGQIGLLEMHASGLAAEDEAERSAMLDLYGAQNADEHARASTAEDSNTTPWLAISSAKAVLGHTRAASGIIALIRTALCLHQRYVPGTPGWRGPAEPEAWAAAGWYVALESRPWATSAAQPRRLAALNGLGDGGAAHAILSQASVAGELVSDYARQSPAQLLVIGASDAPSLAAKLVSVKERLRTCTSLRGAARELEREARGARLKVALVGGSVVELLAEAERALLAIPEAAAAGEEWSTPAGSYFTPTPLGATGELALVYSGGISSYIGLGRTLQRAFPFLTDQLEALGPDLSLVTGERRLYPRSVLALSPLELAKRERQLVEDSFAVAAAGTTHSLQTGALLREVFGVTPRAVFGLSLGEASMMAGQGVWDASELARQAMVDPERVEPQLGRAKLAARDYWGISRDVPAENVWGTYLVLASPDDVAEALKGEDRAFLAMIGTPREALLFGQPDACRRVIGRLGCGSATAPFNYVLHVPPAEAALGAFASLYQRPVVSQPSVRFYSASRPTPLALESHEIASAIAETVCRQLDFPALVRRVYADGVRIFVELGPGATCARWIRESLEPEPHLAVSVDQKGLDSRVTLVRALARLACHGVPLRLEELFGYPEQAASPRPLSVQRVVLGGRSLRAALRPEGCHEGRDVDGSPSAVITPADSTQLPGVLATGRPALLVDDTGATLTVPMMAAAPVRVPADAVAAPSRQRLVAASEGGPLLAAESAFLALQHQAVHDLGGIVERQIGLIASQAGNEVLRDMPESSKPGGGGTRSLEVRPESHWRPSADPLSLQLASSIDALEEPHLSRRGRFPAELPALDHREKEAVWNEADLLEFAQGSIARVFGADYAPIDSYPRRVRLPMPPYLLVSRVTKLQAQRGVFEPSTITTEYDIPLNSGYATDGQVAWAVAVESGQCDLLLISYLGVDFENRGERVYRLLDCALTFLGEVPMEGQTLRYDISINSFARSGDDLLFFFSYDCYVGAQLVLKMDGGCAGFFTDEELAQGKGVIYTEAELAERRVVTPRKLNAPLECGRRAFDDADLERLSAGDLSSVFGAAYDKHGRNPSLRLPPASMRMFDRVTAIEPRGGPWGLGTLVAEKDLSPDDWYFPCHFKDDEVLAGSLMAEGCVQLLELYMLSLGCHTLTRNGRFQPIKGLRQVVRCRGQVTPRHSRMIYQLEVTNSGLVPEPWAIANVEIWVDGKMVVHFKDLGVRIADDQTAIPPPSDPTVTAFDEWHLEEFATGRVAACLGPEAAVYDGRQVPRQPNGDLKLISRVRDLTGVRMDPSRPASLVAEYDVPRDAWFCSEPPSGEVPYSVLMELGLQPCGFLSAWLGSTRPFPDEEFHFRNLDGTGRLLAIPDVRGKTVRNRVRITSSVALQGIIIQKFEYALSCEGVEFFAGDAAFGYFNTSALANQVGLDGGALVRPWPADAGMAIDLPRRGGHLDLLDRVTVARTGGRHGLGYVYGEKRVDPFDWFFSNHFYQDPVMPGSLGVEAMLIALQKLGVGVGRLPLGHTMVWKYRGQIVPSHGRMSLELHVKRVERQVEGVLLVADGSVWRDELRIYEVTDVALVFPEAS
ncbi:MAG TPA: beta-ketoacyl synthase N-terminal-like domain-containing protein [Chloroflexota bacterium]|nr:beta-ketoacyl synthase N-terminal-like domain-containing protein [Chloroflexota bacterium]